MIPGWIHHWQRQFDYEFGNPDLKLMKRIFKNYEIDTSTFQSNMYYVEQLRHLA